MIVVPKNTMERHFKALLEELKEMEKDCEVLNRWAGIRKISPAKKWALLFLNSLKKLEDDLSSLQGFLSKGGHC